MALLLSGCFFGGAPVESTPTGESVAADLQPYYEQVLSWSDCGEGAQCATATAPMDWANPSPETDITLALARHTATGTAMGSLFVNPGGPGASGYDLVHDSVDFAVSETLRENFDIIGWDPRGVGRRALRRSAIKKGAPRIGGAPRGDRHRKGRQTMPMGEAARTGS